MKTKDELNALKEEVEALSKKLAELTEEELEQVTGGVVPSDLRESGVEPPVSEPPGETLPPRESECPTL